MSLYLTLILKNVKINIIKGRKSLLALKKRNTIFIFFRRMNNERIWYGSGKIAFGKIYIYAITCIYKWLHSRLLDIYVV